MNILITGGAGFLGTRLALALLERGSLRGRAIRTLVLADLFPASHPALLADARVRADTGDLLERLPALMQADYDAVFHLASAVSGECEADFELGLRSNLEATRRLLEAQRAQQARTGQAPLFFFASSVAVYGSDAAIPLPAVVQDDTLPTPQSSYGIHKFVCEQLLADYTRKGYIDGRAARLMTVSVRPGRPNGAASGFLSGIVREPLAGLEAVCPVDPSTAVALASPDTTIAGILKVVEASREDFGGRTAVNLPALTVTVAQMLEALGRSAGPEAVARVRIAPDAAVARIVGGWPARFESARAARLGLRADASFDDVIAQFRALS
ncbi:NAD-dependent epimerase/dehydratase family protein [Xylophilus rhododendri]|uniref:NAD-dependent epimerase/dehydratase family protein n=1 Tax=Xylophilus rhododendri TaxID=2697032 RepID=A0A857J6Q1_9BURK|nr:D-erythronate dehydrogenase [Xylophilus rhododendri]QHI98485.1 NAD-dependent epimerase/dehydratase family protein [Xylophilus rhododendri]